MYEWEKFALGDELRSCLCYWTQCQTRMQGAEKDLEQKRIHPLGSICLHTAIPYRPTAHIQSDLPLYAQNIALCSCNHVLQTSQYEERSPLCGIWKDKPLLLAPYTQRLRVSVSQLVTKCVTRRVKNKLMDESVLWIFCLTFMSMKVRKFEYKNVLLRVI